MKVVILAGGRGTRLQEETGTIPKPMVTVGEFPILWHIMKIYSHHGFNEFVILLGYKGQLIKEYFSHYLIHRSSFTIDLQTSALEIHDHNCEPWRVTLVDTGLEMMTGARIAQAAPFIGKERFFLTYGDGVADLNVTKLLEAHRSSKRVVTLTAVQPQGKFGALDFGPEDRVSRFTEKPTGDGSWISGGFFVCEPSVFSYVSEEPGCIFEREPLERLAQDEKLFAYRHAGFWRSMDTLRDKIELNTLWEDGRAPWKIWGKA